MEIAAKLTVIQKISILSWCVNIGMVDSLELHSFSAIMRVCYQHFCNQKQKQCSYSGKIVKVYIDNTYSTCNTQVTSWTLQKCVVWEESGFSEVAICPEHGLGVCHWGESQWRSVQNRFCSWKTLPSASLFFLDSLPAFPLSAMGTADNISLLCFVSLCLHWVWVFLLAPVSAQLSELVLYFTCFYSTFFLSSHLLTALA